MTGGRYSFVDLRECMRVMLGTSQSIGGFKGGGREGRRVWNDAIPELGQVFRIRLNGYFRGASLGFVDCLRSRSWVSGYSRISGSDDAVRYMYKCSKAGGSSGRVAAADSIVGK